MPEGHVIHRLARGLAASLGAESVAASSPQGRFADGAALIDGSSIRRSEAFGKVLFVEFDTGRVLHVHLGLIGKFRQVTHPPPVRDTIRLRLEASGACWDLTGPQTCRIIDPDELHRIVSRIGADPLRRRPDVARARARFARSATPVGTLLLDQSAIAGLGNIYRAEILFLCGIRPTRPSRLVRDDEFERIWSESVRLLRLGVRTGRIVSTDPAEIGRSRARMSLDDTLYVYHRERCRRCGSGIATVHLGGRPIQYCPTCQPD